VSRPVFPFVVGCERSGTTLLRLMLDAHPQLAVPPESYFIVDLWRRRSRYARIDGTIEPDPFRRDLQRHRWFRYWDVPAETLEVALDRPARFPDAIRRLYAAYARLHGKPRYGDKTPAYVQHVRLLADLLPEARFLHLIRDGREVALSLAEVPWGPGNVLDAAIHWAERVERGRRSGPALGHDRYREVRYERLVADPERELEGVAAFFDLGFDRSMLRHAERSRVRVPRPGLEHERSMAEPRPGARDWRREMAPEDLEAVEAAVGDLLDDMGYERAVPVPSAEARRRAGAARRRRERKHRWRRIKARWPLGSLSRR
jgi:hypothetical protein